MKIPRKCSEPVLNRAGPLMIAIILMMGTKYDCINGHERDQIWLQRWWQFGPNMIAICFLNRTIYDSNLFQKGPNMTAVVENFISQDLSINQGTWLWWFSTLQSYLKKIAIKHGPIRNSHCNHNCPSKKLLQLNVVHPYRANYSKFVLSFLRVEPSAQRIFETIIFCRFSDPILMNKI